MMCKWCKIQYVKLTATKVGQIGHNQFVVARANPNDWLILLCIVEASGLVAITLKLYQHPGLSKKIKLLVKDTKVFKWLESARSRKIP